MTCPSCGRVLPSEFAFCPYCGASAAAGPRGPGREERKVVTVVFADLVGFTARAERLDPEDVRALLASYHSHLRLELERFGGTVEKFIGDAVMAVFGAPVAHEDDCERAVRAALAIQDWAAGQAGDLQVRIAVNTGEALVALDARPGEGEAMVAGDVVNTAARLQAAAPLNGVLVGEQTYRVTSEVVDYRRAQPVVGKGKREPIRAWQALRARPRVDADASQRLLAPLIGRTRELELLALALARVREASTPQLVTLVGVPGIGKSRLLFELSRAARRDAAEANWLQGRSLPYGDGVTFWALAEIVKAKARILETDSPSQAQAKLGRLVGDLVADAAEGQWLERQLRPLAGLGDAGPSDRQEQFAAWRRLFEALAEQGPLVLVLEDLHWADDVLLDFVDELVARTTRLPLLVLGTARPELLERRPGWGGGKPNAITLSLSPLSEEETARLVGALLERPLLEGRTQEALVARAGGNPLYAEQYVRMLLEGGDLPELPEAVQGIIAARLDALSDEEKRLLQDAAVVGSVFWLGAVEALGGVARAEAGELLYALERKEFVERARGSSVAGEHEYAFRHALIRNVAYRQIPRAARVRKHRCAARWIESLGRPDDQAEALAHHYLQALELAEAAGIDSAALGESARHALRDAGDRATALHSAATADRFYDAALRLWPDADRERAQILLRRATTAGRWGGGDRELLLEARDALLAVGDAAGSAEAEMLLSETARMQGRLELAGQHADRALALLDDASPTPSTAWVLARLATRASLAGRDEQARDLASQACDLAERLGSEEGLCEALDVLGTVRLSGGDRGGLDDLARSIEIATAAGALGTLSRAYNGLAVAYQMLGDLEAATEARLEGARLARRLGSEPQVRWFEGVLTDHHYRRGDWSTALRTADAFLLAVETGSPHYAAWQVHAIRAEIRLARDDVAGAIRDAELALAAGRAVAEPQAVYFVLPACAHVLSDAGDHARALPIAREYLSVLAHGVGLQFAVINLPTFAVAARRLDLSGELVEALAGRPESPWTEAAGAYARGDFSAAAATLERTGSKPERAEAQLAAADRLAARGFQPEAREQLAHAEAFYRAVGATRYLLRCEPLLATLDEGR